MPNTAATRAVLEAAIDVLHGQVDLRVLEALAELVRTERLGDPGAVLAAFECGAVVEGGSTADDDR